MKLTKLLPIVALSGIATVAMPLVSCNNKPSQKTMTIKTSEGDLPDYIIIDQSVELVAIDENGDPIVGAEFKTNDPYDIIKIEGNTITGLSEGTATVLCSAPGYKDASWRCEVHNSEDCILINTQQSPTLLSNENEITFAKGQSFDVKFNWSDALGVSAKDAEGGWCLCCGVLEPTFDTTALNTSSVSIKVNGSPLENTKYRVNDYDIQPKIEWNLKEKDVIEISFELSSEEDPEFANGYIFISSDTK